MAKITALSILTYRLTVREPGRATCTLGKTEGTRAHAEEVAYDRYEKLAIDQGDRPLPRSQVYVEVIPKCGICGRDNRGPWDICEKCDEPTVKDCTYLGDR